MRNYKKITAAVWFALIALLMGGSAALANDYAVCLDPGHQGSWVDMSAMEPMAPGSGEMKAKATTGTQGTFTGVPEYQLNLDIALALEKELTERGYRVEMTRRDNDTAISNSERALYASEKNCDVMVRIHANGATDPQTDGALAMVMSQGNPYVGNLFEESYRLALNVLNSYCQETGFVNRGIQAHDDMTGINWSKIPVMILEMGYMSNQSDDTKMEDPQMQVKMVHGIADGIDAYFRVGEETETESASDTEGNETERMPEEEMHPEPDPSEVPMQGIASRFKIEDNSIPEETEEVTYNDYLTEPLMKNLYDQYIFPREQKGQLWAVSLEVLSEAENKEDAQEAKAATEKETASEADKAAGEKETEAETASGAEEKKTEAETALAAGEKESEDNQEDGKDSEKKLYEYKSDIVMQSASVIKVFIMGTVYDRVLYPKDEEQAVVWQNKEELNSLLEAMITVSDNSAANRLIEIVGGGDFQKGAETIREFCMENGYVSTSIGRRFMEEHPTGDNYTSAADCRRILSDIYYGKCVNEEASQKMLATLKRQSLRNKIPSGLPSGFSCANKTGEMPDGYGLGCIENDIAIVFGPEKSYVLCVLSNNLGGDNTSAQQNIAQISSYVASELK